MMKDDMMNFRTLSDAELVRFARDSMLYDRHRLFTELTERLADTRGNAMTESGRQSEHCAAGAQKPMPLDAREQVPLVKFKGVRRERR
jgi:hypothetical protein